MTTVGIILCVLMGILSLLLTFIILLQSDRSAGLGAVSSANSDSYWNKNKASSMEGALEIYTKIGGALFIILALLINFFA